jgi:copper resistance protein B
MPHSAIRLLSTITVVPALLLLLLLPARPAAAQHVQSDGHAGHGSAGGHGATTRPAAPSDFRLDPVLPEGHTLEEMLDYAAKPPPPSWSAPINDNAVFTFTQFELLEYRFTNDGRDELGYDSQGWIGTDHHKFWWKSEGDMSFDGPNEGAVNAQALYATPISPFWYLQAGVEFEENWEPGNTHERFSGVLGLQGIAPYQFDVEPALFLTDHGEVLGQLTASYYLYLTQRWVIQPRLELGASAQDVPDLGFGAGLNYGDFSVRLLYEVRREVAPYVGVRYYKLFGESADIATRRGGEDELLQLVLGVRLTF